MDPNQKESRFDRLLSNLDTIALVLIVGSMRPPLIPEWGWWAGISILVVTVITALSRQFLMGVHDAGGWNNKAPVNPPAPTPDAPADSN